MHDMYVVIFVRDSEGGKHNLVIKRPAKIYKYINK